MQKTVLITGASEGIGKALSLLLAKQRAGLVLIARSEDKLHALKKNCLAEGAAHVDIFSLDVADWSAVQHMAAHYTKPIDALINNAGLAFGKDTMWQTSHDDTAKMLQVNVEGTLNICRAFIPRLLSQKSGDIINLSSIAAHQTYPGGSIYCATKHAVRAITDTLRLELLGTGVRVMMISPGMVETNFSIHRYRGDEKQAQQVYQGLQPLLAEDIAETLVFMLLRPRHVCIADLIIYPSDQASVRDIHRNS